mmetsp:Transcript_59644/g.169677  ORF Transcript_59644/g.169677 Transcript_59644/m.169677 type:complete len:235 (+) Transcript_59644:67-771(+)
MGCIRPLVWTSGTSCSRVSLTQCPSWHLCSVRISLPFSTFVSADEVTTWPASLSPRASPSMSLSMCASPPPMCLLKFPKTSAIVRPFIAAPNMFVSARDSPWGRPSAEVLFFFVVVSCTAGGVLAVLFRTRPTMLRRPSKPLLPKICFISSASSRTTPPTAAGLDSPPAPCCTWRALVVFLHEPSWQCTIDVTTWPWPSVFTSICSDGPLASLPSAAVHGSPSSMPSTVGCMSM